MKIGIVGAGSIGLAMASYLAPHHNVRLFTRTKEQATAITTNGLTRVRKQESVTVRVEAEPFVDAQQLANCDLIFVTLKQYNLVDFIYQVREVASDFVFLQNGLTHLQLVKELQKANAILLGVVELGAMRLDFTTVQQNGDGRILIGPYCGEPNFDCALLSTAELPILYSVDTLTILKEKLIVNAVINPISAVYGLTNGEIPTHPEASALVRLVLSESCDVLGFQTEAEKMHRLRKILAICQNTYENKSSMLYDIEHRRKTEIDAILGYIIKQAKETGIQTPACIQLFDQVKQLEKRG